MNASNEPFEKLLELVKDVRFATLVTRAQGGVLQGRPMTTQCGSGSPPCLYFLTAVGSSKVEQIRADPRVSLSYGDASSQRYVFVTGTARIENDRARIRDFWHSSYSVWFDGPDDPSIRLLIVEPTQASYWSGPGKVASVLAMVKALAGGKPADLGDSGTVHMPPRRRSSISTEDTVMASTSLAEPVVAAAQEQKTKVTTQSKIGGTRPSTKPKAKRPPPRTRAEERMDTDFDPDPSPTRPQVGR
jgi:general stress protein 26